MKVNVDISFNGIFSYKNSKTKDSNPQINKYSSLASLKRDVVSFSGKTQPVAKEKMSDEEFEKLKKEVEEKISSCPYNSTISTTLITKGNISLAHKFLFDERLFSCGALMEKAGNILCNTYFNNQAEAKCAIIDKILSDEKLLNNETFMKEAAHILNAASSKVQCDLANKILSDERLFNNETFMKEAANIISVTNSEAQYGLANKILSDERLFNNENFVRRANDIIFYASFQKKAEVKCTIIDKILSDERLFNNKDFMNEAGELVYLTDSDEQVKVKCAIIDKILSDERLFNNEALMREMAYIVSYVNSEPQYKLAAKILSDERLFNNEDFMWEFRPIIECTEYDAQAEIKGALIDKILSDERLFNNKEFMKKIGSIVFTVNSKEQMENVSKILDDKELLPQQITTIFSYDDNHLSIKECKRLNKTIGVDNAKTLSVQDTKIAAKMLCAYGKHDINEISAKRKREFLRNLVAANTELFNTSDDFKKMFPIVPSNQEEYCSLLPSLVRSLGIETNVLNKNEIEEFNISLENLSGSLNELSDEEFNLLEIEQEYPKDEFIQDVLDKVKDLSPNERQKVYDYFGFELYHNEKNETGFSITGYPVNLNNGKKLSKITNPHTKEVVESLRSDVIRFSENNKVKCNNKEVERDLNEIVSKLPEICSMIGRIQHGFHEFDVLKHSLKVMQKIVQSNEFKMLNESDKKIMLLSSLLHDITKTEGRKSIAHADESSFDAFFITKKFNLTQEEQIKLHTLIKNHEWLGYVNTFKDNKELQTRLQSVAYDLRHDNLFDMALIFTHADLKAVKKDGSIHDSVYDEKGSVGWGRKELKGKVRSFGESADIYAGNINDTVDSNTIRGYINELKKSQPLLPVTKLPKASKIKEAITRVNSDGSTDIKGIYVNEEGLVIIKFNELENEDLEKIGFPKGSLVKGIKTQTEMDENINTGNVKFIVHGLDCSNQLAKFDAFSLVDSNALLSVSYSERPESKYRFFRPQGVLLDVDTKYIHGGGETDSGSGYGKSIQDFKDNYIFNEDRENDRLFISNLIKEATGMNDKEYIEFVKENENKPFSDIEPENVREKIIKAFSSINSNTRRGKREYNEIYASNPKPPMGVFAYSEDYEKEIKNPVEFLNRSSIKGCEIKPVKQRTEFLQKYALERDIPFILFGN